MYIYTLFIRFVVVFLSFGECQNKYIIIGHNHFHFSVTNSSHIILHLILTFSIFGYT